jgi:hypothetical protein
LLFVVVISFAFSEADTEFVGVVSVVLQLDDVVPESNGAVVVVEAEVVTAVEAVPVDLAGSGW